MAAKLERNRPALIAGWSRSTNLRLLALWLAPLAFLGLFYFYPLASILGTSFARLEQGDANPLLQAIQSAGMRRIFGFTLWQAGLSTLLTLIVGLPGAYLLARYDFRGKSLVRALTGIAFVLPALVVAAAFNSLLGANGWVNQALMSLFDLSRPPIQFTNTLAAILVAHVFYNTTIVLRFVGDFWSHLDPRLEQAAAMLGASRWQRLRLVTLPLLTPAITTAALLIFIFDFTSFGVILVLGGPRFATLETEIYYQTVGLFNLPLAAVLAIVQLTCTLALTVAYTRLQQRVSRPLTIRPRAYTQKQFNSWRTRLFASVYFALLLVFMLAPLVALAARSVTRLNPAVGESGLTLDYYRELNVNRRGALFYAPPAASVGISLGYATMTTALALLLGLPAAWALARDRGSPVNRTLDPLLMLPLGTSAVTLGLGFIVALDSPPLDLRASLWLIPLAHTLVAFPFVVRSLSPSLQSIRPRLRQAAAMLGANPRQAFRYIDLPLVGRALLVAAIFAFSISLGEFGATAMIARPEYPTLPVAIYRLISQPGAINYGQAMALSTILMLITCLGMLAIERFRVADIGEF
jgi:thiamine transport system permease protein